ncbi:hypothetical protein VTJ04DRAFT_7138 [Mycothermus thermophilus]|uniref:uncharacterized protein n=1 Tax=Humicola insolens TaxID=85995 RepID=UPI00374405BD
MSTIASPRDPGGPFPRRANSSIITPTSSTRPSLDVTPAGSPTPSSSTSNNPIQQQQSKRSTRAALREYYNLRSPSSSSTSTPTVEITTTDLLSSSTQQQQQLPPQPPQSELDDPAFDAAAYTARLLREGSLPDLLRAYARALSEARALDAERKALVYDNYSKLIAATETIRRMMKGAGAGDNTGSGVGVGDNITTGGGGGGSGSDAAAALVAGGALDAVVERIYNQAKGLREELRARVEEEKKKAEQQQQQQQQAGEEDDPKKAEARQRTRELAREVLRVPDRVKKLVQEGRTEEARKEWELPRRLLVKWKEMGVGGEEVGRLIEEGDEALKGGEAVREGE